MTIWCLMKDPLKYITIMKVELVNNIDELYEGANTCIIKKVIRDDKKIYNTYLENGRKIDIHRMHLFKEKRAINKVFKELV